MCLTVLLLSFRRGNIGNPSCSLKGFQSIELSRAIHRGFWALPPWALGRRLPPCNSTPAITFSLTVKMPLFLVLSFSVRLLFTSYFVGICCSLVTSHQTWDCEGLEHGQKSKLCGAPRPCQSLEVFLPATPPCAPVRTYWGDPPGMLWVDGLQYLMGLLHISGVSFLFGPGFPLDFILCSRLWFQKWEASPDYNNRLRKKYLVKFFFAYLPEA